MSEKRFNDPLEELTVKVIELDEIRELRMVMIGGFIAVTAVSILLKLLLG